MSRRISLSVCIVLVCLASCKGKKNKVAVPEVAAGPAYTPLYRFWDSWAKEHLYTYEGTEPVAWRAAGNFVQEHVVGYAVNTPEPGTVRLWRAYCHDGRHYFYIDKPAAATDIQRIEDFLLYVWTQPGDGRVPVHASYLTDDKDPLFDTSLDAIKSHAASMLAQFGVQRKIVESAFYVYPTGPNVLKAPPTVNVMAKYRQNFPQQVPPSTVRPTAGTPPQQPSTPRPDVDWTDTVVQPTAIPLSETAVTSTSLSPDGTVLGLECKGQKPGSNQNDYILAYYDLTARKKVQTIPQILGVGRLSNRGTLAAYVESPNLFVRDLTTGQSKEIARLSNDKPHCDISPDGRFVVATHGSKIEGFTTATGQPAFPAIETPTPILATSRMFKDGTRLGTLHIDGGEAIVRFWDLSKGQPAGERKLDRGAKDPMAGTHEMLDIAPDGRSMVVFSEKGDYHVWDLIVGQRMKWTEDPKFKFKQFRAMSRGRIGFTDGKVEIKGGQVETSHFLAVVHIDSGRNRHRLMIPTMETLVGSHWYASNDGSRVVMADDTLQKILVWDLPRN